MNQVQHYLKTFWGMKGLTDMQIADRFAEMENDA